jgi:hypothetical protein
MPLPSSVENVQPRTVWQPWRESLCPAMKNMSVQISLAVDPPEEDPMQNLLHHDAEMSLSNVFADLL